MSTQKLDSRNFLKKLLNKLQSQEEISDQDILDFEIVVDLLFAEILDVKQ